MTVEVAGNSRSFGYVDERQAGVPVHSAPMQAAAPQAAPRQLNANQPSDIGGPAMMIAKPIVSRVKSFLGGASSSRPGGTMPGMPKMPGAGGGGGAAEGAAAEGGMAAADVGLDVVAPEIGIPLTIATAAAGAAQNS